MEYGRGDMIRTCDSCVPNAVLYQAELHPDGASCCPGKYLVSLGIEFSTISIDRERAEFYQSLLVRGV